MSCCGVDARVLRSGLVWMLGPAFVVPESSEILYVRVALLHRLFVVPVGWRSKRAPSLRRPSWECYGGVVRCGVMPWCLSICCTGQHAQ